MTIRGSRRLPDFLVMGVPKAGTTSMHHYLRRHPQLFLPEDKEVHHFTSVALQRNVEGPGDRRAARRTCRTLDEYAALFRSAAPDQLAGEVSPSYLYFTECYEQIRATLGAEVKLIVLLRNPIDRAFSHYNHLRRHGLEHLPFAEALEREDDRAQRGYGDFWRYKDHSRYAARLDALGEVFPDGSVLVLSFHELAADPAASVRRVARFLGVDDTHRPANADQVFNAGLPTRTGWATDRLLAHSSAKTWLKRHLPVSVTDAYRAARDGWLTRGADPLPALDDASVEHLQAEVGGEVEAVRRRFGIDLAASSYAAGTVPPAPTTGRR